MLKALLEQNDKIVSEGPNFSKIVETALRTVKIVGTSFVHQTKGNITTVIVIPGDKVLWRDIVRNLMSGYRSDLQNVLEELTGREIYEIVFKELRIRANIPNIIIDIVFRS